MEDYAAGFIRWAASDKLSLMLGGVRWSGPKDRRRNCSQNYASYGLNNGSAFSNKLRSLTAVVESTL